MVYYVFFCVGCHTQSQFMIAAVAGKVPGDNPLPVSLHRVQEITGKRLRFYRADMTDEAALRKICEVHKIDCTIHFAALKAVGQSVSMPLEYYANNVGGTVALLKVQFFFVYPHCFSLGG